MKYKMLLWPHANARYQNATLKLAEAELRLMLDHVAPETLVEIDETLGIPALNIECDNMLSESALEIIRTHSLLYILFEMRQDGSFMPLISRMPAWLGQDLPAILKYKGKTNEMFLHMMINVALHSGAYWNKGGNVLEFLDPMCGRGTSLFIAANRRWNTTGTDVDKNDLKETEKFLKKYLEYHRFKHQMTRKSLTIQKTKPAPMTHFCFSDTPEHFKEKNIAELSLVNMDAAYIREAFGKNAFHMIICDLPYGVQHDPHDHVKGGLEGLMRKSLPGWRDALKQGGTIAVSYNAQTLKTERMRALMAEAGLEVMSGGAYDCFEHWVEQAITRDIAVCRKK